MNAILNLLTPGQIEFIISAYGTVETWFDQYGSALSIAQEDIML